MLRRDKSAFGATLVQDSISGKAAFHIQNVQVEFVRSLLLFVTDIDPYIFVEGKNLCNLVYISRSVTITGVIHAPRCDAI